MRREAYVNDQGAQASLVAATARSNRSKADQDPARWLLLAAEVHCRYVAVGGYEAALGTDRRRDGGGSPAADAWLS